MSRLETVQRHRVLSTIDVQGEELRVMFQDPEGSIIRVLQSLAYGISPDEDMCCYLQVWAHLCLMLSVGVALPGVFAWQTLTSSNPRTTWNEAMVKIDEAKEFMQLTLGSWLWVVSDDSDSFL